MRQDVTGAEAAEIATTEPFPPTILRHPVTRAVGNVKIRGPNYLPLSSHDKRNQSGG